MSDYRKIQGNPFHRQQFIVETAQRIIAAQVSAMGMTVVSMKYGVYVAEAWELAEKLFDSMPESVVYA